jgi:hypothetical protein
MVEEIECFRHVTFSPDKYYEYVYATRKSFEYIPAIGRSDWRYFTEGMYNYAGKWLRSCSSGFGDGGNYWEVFSLDDGSENIVSWDYDATLCFRESTGRVSHMDIEADTTTIIIEILNDIIDNIVIENESADNCVFPAIHNDDDIEKEISWSPPPSCSVSSVFVALYHVIINGTV